MAWFAVLGERLGRGNHMSEILRRRLDVCLRQLRRGDRVIVCGSNVCGAACTHSEAFMMRKYLMAQGRVSRDSVVLENRSKDTRGNIRHLARLCRKLRIQSLTIISSRWHLPRVRHLAERAGLSQACAVRFLASRDKVSPARMRLEAKHLAAEKGALWPIRRPLGASSLDSTPRRTGRRRTGSPPPL